MQDTCNVFEDIKEISVWFCHLTRAECLTDSLLCDGRYDCADRSDESECDTDATSEAVSKVDPFLSFHKQCSCHNDFFPPFLIHTVEGQVCPKSTRVPKESWDQCHNNDRSTIIRAPPMGVQRWQGPRSPHGHAETLSGQQVAVWVELQLQRIHYCTW